MDSPDELRLWSIQDVAALRALDHSGVLRGSFSRVSDLSDRETVEAYRWMSAQMVSRGIASSVHCPVWAWCRYRGIANPRPDLRRRWHLPRGMKGVCLEIVVPSSRVLLSQFEMWLYVMDRRTVPHGSKFNRRVKENLTYEKGSRTWQRIFDLCAGDEDYWGSLDERAIQGCLQQIKKSDIVRIVEFTAR